MTSTNGSKRQRKQLATPSWQAKTWWPEKANESRTRVTHQPGDELHLETDHVFPPVERDKPSHKLRRRWMGPHTVVRRVGDLAVELNVKGDELLDHPVFHVESMKLCPPGTVLRKAERSGAPVDGDRDERVVKSIDDFRCHFRKPQWSVNWRGSHVEGTTTRVPQTGGWGVPPMRHDDPSASLRSPKISFRLRQRPDSLCHMHACVPHQRHPK